MAKYKTKQKEAIQKCVELHADGYVTVNDISDYLKENQFSVGTTTIYRNLETMEEEGIVTRLNVDGESGTCFKFIHPGDNSNDYFFIKCEKCGEVTIVECHHLSELYDHVCEDHYFTVNSEKTMFYGKCGKCNKL